MTDLEEKRAELWTKMSAARPNCTCINPFIGMDAPPYVGEPRLLCQELGCCYVSCHNMGCSDMSPAAGHGRCYSFMACRPVGQHGAMRPGRQGQAGMQA